MNILMVLQPGHQGTRHVKTHETFCPRSILITIYKSLILPYLNYCCLVWDNCSNYLLDNLQKIQNKAARIITGESYEIRSSDLLRKLNWPILKERRPHQKAMFMFKVKNEQVAQSVAELFSVTNNENHELRSNNKNYFNDKPKTNFIKESIGYSGASYWNNLPRSYKTEGINLQQFRALLRDGATKQ